MASADIEDGAGRFPQVAGLKYTFDKSKPPGEPRSRRAWCRMATPGWRSIRTRPMASSPTTLCAPAGDGYAVFAQNGKNAYDFGPDLEAVVADYLAAIIPTSLIPTAA